MMKLENEYGDKVSLSWKEMVRFMIGWTDKVSSGLGDTVSEGFMIVEREKVSFGELKVYGYGQKKG